MNDVLPTARNKGRPSYEPTEADRQYAVERAAAGDADEAIADGLGVSLPTLRKRLAASLAEGRAMVQPSLLESVSLAKLPPAPRRGRKRYLPTSADRDRVKLLVASGVSYPVIARRLGISEPTLRRAFAADFETARDEKRAETIELLQRMARKGSVPAIKHLREIFDETDLSKLSVPTAGATRGVERETAGKKVLAQRAAQDEWNSGKWSKAKRLEKAN